MSWFENNEEPSAFLLRANRFLRLHSVDGIAVVNHVLKTQSGGKSSPRPVVEFLKNNGLARIAERLSDDLGLEQVSQLRDVTEQDLDDLVAG